MKAIVLAFYTLIGVALGGHTIVANNDVTTKNVRILDFSKIEINGVEAQIRYSQADNYEVKVTTNEYLHDILTITVDVNTLVIKPSDKYKKNRKKAACLIIDISSPGIELIRNNSNSNIQFETEIAVPEFRIENNAKGNISGMKSVETDKMEIENTNAGNITLVGKIQKADMLLLGTGKLNLENCSIKNCKCEHSGAGDLYVYVTSKLDAKIFGKGNIYYMGEPKIISETPGTGRLIKR